MPKALVIAATEFRGAVRTKAFLLSIVLMPLLFAGAMAVARFAEREADERDRAFAVLDRTGVLYAGIERRAADRARRADSAPGLAARGRFLPRRADAAGRNLDALRLSLSDAVRRKELFAFVEIPPEVLEAEPGKETVAYHSESPTYRELPEWIAATVNAEARAFRLRAAGIDPTTISKLDRRIEVERRGTWVRAPDGGLGQAEKVDPVRTFIVPAVLLFLLFGVVMTTTPQLMNAVLEEKMNRVSEVLLGSATPTELMAGKLAGNVGVSALIAAIYLAGGAVLAARMGYADVLSPAALAWFSLFAVLALFLYGSIFLAIGAACNELKETQSYLTPVMILLVFPLITWPAVLRAPDATLALVTSFFPLSAPYMMLLRIALQPPPPTWQPVVSLVLCAAATYAVVLAAGRVFRVGLLMRGKAPSPAELWRWARAAR